MPNDIDYVWMAAAAYNESRDEEKRVKPGFGWDSIDTLDVPGAESGFAAKVYRQNFPQGSSGSGEIVIAFRGTNLDGNPLKGEFRKDTL